MGASLVVAPAHDSEGVRSSVTSAASRALEPARPASDHIRVPKSREKAVTAPAGKKKRLKDRADESDEAVMGAAILQNKAELYRGKLVNAAVVGLHWGLTLAQKLPGLWATLFRDTSELIVFFLRPIFGIPSFVISPFRLPL